MRLETTFQPLVLKRRCVLSSKSIPRPYDGDATCVSVAHRTRKYSFAPSNVRSQRIYGEDSPSIAIASSSNERAFENVPQRLKSHSFYGAKHRFPVQKRQFNERKEEKNHARRKAVEFRNRYIDRAVTR